MKCWLMHALKSSIGLKVIMALTGLMLFGFLLAHLAGNLIIFAGADAFNAYGQSLRDLGPLLWVARIGLLVIFVSHITSAIILTQRNRAARGSSYAFENKNLTSHASRTMMVTGSLVLAYLAFHLAHYTLHLTHPEYADLNGDIYQMVVSGFSEPLVSGIYIIAMLLIGFHLSHGIASLFLTLGFNHPKYKPSIKCAGLLASLVISLGFISIPLAVLLGFIQ
ncbi:MAG: succinate dehydrogenase cytochrome b subunit [Oligoflexales bacterium]|nr:succinate dehydrogenase cytochrome b subunit [Oligoflexales bacterium]